MCPLKGVALYYSVPLLLSAGGGDAVRGSGGDPRRGEAEAGAVGVPEGVGDRPPEMDDCESLLECS